MTANDDEAAGIAYSVLFDPKAGFARKGVVDIDGIAKVLELRSKFGQPRKSLGEPGRYFDPSYLEAALRD
jgi:hypothetical protein